MILTNNEESNLKLLISDLSKKADKIKIATAFFSDTTFITDWLNSSKNIELLVSLRPPTNYYSLKYIYPKLGIGIQFLGNNFHSKFFIFYTKGTPFACIIGSSNFTAGGLHKNIETNAILTDIKYLTEIDREFSNLWNESFSLQPTDLDNFKLVFDNFQKRAEQTEKEQEEFQKKILTKRTIKKKTPKVGREATQYFSFWRVVDEVKEMVSVISKKEYPGIPVYITIDHFWHWIKIIWARENRTKPTSLNRNIIVPKLFQEYCNWDKSTNNYTKEMAKTSKNVFARLLSETNIDKLTVKEAKQLYANLHSGAMRARRFGSDKTFIMENSIQKIRTSLKYLLYSNDELSLRIHNLCFNLDYKLSQFKSSGTQEIIGWVSPEKYPIRNDKADDALKLLGYDIE